VALTTINVDLCVYSGSPAALACAIRAAREGLSVLVVTHTPHLGGMLTSGLCVWDTQWEGRRSPIYDEWRAALFDYYLTSYGHRSPEYMAALPGPRGYSNGNFEPKVAREVIERLVAKEPRIQVERTAFPIRLNVEDRRITEVEFQRDKGAANFSVAADSFADGSYEGDLMALAGCAYRTGRESREEYGEPAAGRIFVRPVAEAPNIEAVRKEKLKAALRLRPFHHFAEILDAPEAGKEDDRIQGYNLRTVVTNDPNNQRPVTRPPGYDRDRIASEPDLMMFAKSPLYHDGGVPNRKARLNRPQLMGEQTHYPDGSWALRRQVIEAHWQMLQSYIYFLRNDKSVPEEYRQLWQDWGLAADEFTDNNGQPYEIYARETRRLLGRYVFTSHDATLVEGLDRTPVHGSSIAITEWYIDSHNTSHETWEDSALEGKIMMNVDTFPGMVPYEALLPNELDNLLVINCVSSSHVGWNTIRLEPTWMNIGEAAGWAFALARDADVAPADVDSDSLVRTLAASGVMVSFFNDLDVASRDSWVVGAQYLGTQGFFANYDVRPEEQLDHFTAALWVKAAADIRAKSANPDEIVRAVHDAGGNDSRPVSGREFEELLATSGFTTPRLPDVFTRGDACRVLFELTAP
jgi:hypothetical protein